MWIISAKFNGRGNMAKHELLLSKQNFSYIIPEDSRESFGKFVKHEKWSAQSNGKFICSS